MNTTHAKIAVYLLLQFFGLLFCYGQDTSKNQIQKPISRERWREMTHEQWKEVNRYGDLIKPDIQFPDSLFEKGSQALVRLSVVIRNPGTIDTCVLSDIYLWPKGTKDRSKFKKLFSDFYGRQLKRSTPLGDSLAKKLAPWIENYRKHLTFIPNPAYYEFHKDQAWFSLGIEFEVGVKSKKGKK